MCSCVQYGVVPLAMERRLSDAELGDLGIGYLYAFRVALLVKLYPNRVACLGGGASNQVHDHVLADQRPGAPVLCDVAEHPMLDLVPLAGPRWEVADGDLQADLVGQTLQFGLPQAGTLTVAAPAIRGDQEFLGCRIASSSHL
jgi:hypothetical protein